MAGMNRDRQLNPQQLHHRNWKHRGVDRQEWLHLGLAGLAIAITVNLLNAILASPPRQVMAQARPLLIESTMDLRDLLGNQTLTQGDRLYRLRQVNVGAKTETKAGAKIADELWLSDGRSPQGKRLYRWPDRSDSLQLQFLGSQDQTLLLSDKTGQLWRYDDQVMQAIARTPAAIGARAAASIKGQILWTQDGPQGSEIWASDGKVARSIYRLPSNPGSESKVVYPQLFMPLKDNLLFTTGLSGGLWSIDGRSDRLNTRRIAAINPAGQPFTPWGDRVFIEAETKSQGWELWTSDGKTAQSLGDFHPGPESSAPQILGGQKDLLFLARTPKGHELFATRGTTATTRSVKVLNSRATNLLNPGVASLGDRLFFAVDAAGQGTELWVSDGTTAQTMRLAQFPEQSGVRNLTAIGDRVLFSATDRNGNELWVSDGTAKGTRMVRDLAPGSNTVEVMSCQPRNPLALPLAPANAVVPPGPPQGGPPPPPCPDPQRRSVTITNSASPSFLTPFKGQVYFIAQTGSNPNNPITALWVSDGTDRGTRQLQELGTDSRIQAFPNWLAISGTDRSGKPQSWILR
jgi:ELWxxDGT repeat protein